MAARTKKCNRNIFEGRGAFRLWLLLLQKSVEIDDDVAILRIVGPMSCVNLKMTLLSELRCTNSAAVRTTLTSLWLSRGRMTGSTALHRGASPAIREVAEARFTHSPPHISVSRRSFQLQKLDVAFLQGNSDMV